MTETVRPPMTLTDTAALKARRLADISGLAEEWRLRIGVAPGGCSGLRYQVFFDDRVLADDTAWTVPTEDGDLDVVVDRMSVAYLDGALMDYHDTIEKQGFTIDNPNATGTCSCGDSFH